jgi:(R)-2-hydroxyacyl-CoA dehydratese activating ATPase
LIKSGLDIGSRTIAYVELDGDDVVFQKVMDTTYDPIAECRRLLGGRRYDALTATGYGRHLAAENFGANAITEIKAFATGAAAIQPGCRGVLDIGGQDVKIIALNEQGKVADFEMNDRCAAGTGKFLEVMATVLGFEIADFGAAALTAKSPVKVNSTCTVFAESEVVSLIAKGADRADIAYGIHDAIADRTQAMVNRVGVNGDLFFAGGAARNVALQKILGEKLGVKLYVPENPQTVGALGAALSV